MKVSHEEEIQQLKDIYKFNFEKNVEKEGNSRGNTFFKDFSEQITMI